MSCLYLAAVFLYLMLDLSCICWMTDRKHETRFVPVIGCNIDSRIKIPGGGRQRTIYTESGGGEGGGLFPLQTLKNYNAQRNQYTQFCLYMLIYALQLK